MSIKGIHHATVIATDAQRTVDFYTGMLGLRLVKRSVDPDDPSAYHLFFGDDAGRPGSLLTVLARRGAVRGRTGIGGTHHLAWATTSRDSLLRWKRWLGDRGLRVSGPYDRVYFTSIYLTDPDGLIIEIATNGPGWTVDEAPPPSAPRSSGRRRKRCGTAATRPRSPPRPGPSRSRP